jgi:hypothetical protein
MRGATLKTLALATAALVSASTLPQAVGQVVSYSGGIYSENFDSMGTAGTATVNGWYVYTGAFNQTTRPDPATLTRDFATQYANTPITVADGSAGPVGGNFGHNVGTTGDPDRAQGSATTGRSAEHLLVIRNDTGGNLVSVNLRYTGEQWRTDTSATLSDQLVMYYSADGITFQQMGSTFNYSSTVPINVAQQLDGNQATNRQVGIGGTYNLPVVATPGANMYFLWFDDNPGGTDGLPAIDDVTFESAPCEPVVITQQPVGTNVAEKGTIVLRVVTTGSVPTYQWVKNGVDILGATGPTLTIPNANPATMVANGDDNGMYKCRVGGACSAAVDSTEVAVNVIPDTTGPTLLYAVAGPNLDVITVVFSEQMDPDYPSANNLADTFEWDVINETTMAFLTDDSIVLTNVNGGTNNGLHIVLSPLSPMNATDKYSVNRSGADAADTAEERNILTAPITKLVSKFENTVIDLATFVWRYDDTGTDLGTAWKEVVYAGEGAMASGIGILDGKRDGGGAPNPTKCRLAIPTPGPGGDATVRSCINISNSLNSAQIPSVYFRGHFSYAGSSPTAVIRMVAAIDDGFVMYLNGVEVLRDGMDPTVADTFTQLANRTQNDNTYDRAYEIVVNNLVMGDNVLAVSMHQVNLTSSDLTWGLRMILVEDCPPVCVPVTVVQDPASQTVNEGQNVTFTVGVAGTPPYTFQWEKMGSGPILDATNSSLTLSNVCPDANGMYKVTVGNCGGSGSAISAAASLTVTPESTRPTVASVAGQPSSLADILVTYSEGMDATSAGNAANYAVSGGHAVVGAAVVNATTVRLNVNPALTLCEVVTVTIQNVTDDACIPNVLDPNPTSRTFTVNAQTLVAHTSTWAYDTNSQDSTLPPNPGPAWYDPAFVPVGWLSGSGMFGLETSGGIVAQFPAPINTPLVSPPTNVSPAQLAFFFRQNIVLPAIPAGVKYVACHFIDDGAAFYLDGVDIQRVNLSVPAPILFTNQANAAGEASLQCFELNTTAGAHLLAVEVHQNGLTSSDVLFSTEIRAVKCPAPLTITRDGVTGVVTVTWTPEPGWVLADSSEPSGLVDDYDPTAGANNATGTFSTVANPPANRFFALIYTGRP